MRNRCGPQNLSDLIETGPPGIFVYGTSPRKSETVLSILQRKEFKYCYFDGLSIKEKSFFQQISKANESSGNCLYVVVDEADHLLRLTAGFIPTLFRISKICCIFLTTGYWQHLHEITGGHFMIPICLPDSLSSIKEKFLQMDLAKELENYFHPNVIQILVDDLIAYCQDTTTSGNEIMHAFSCLSLYLVKLGQAFRDNHHTSIQLASPQWTSIRALIAGVIEQITQHLHQHTFTFDDLEPLLPSPFGFFSSSFSSSSSSSSIPIASFSSARQGKRKSEETLYNDLPLTAKYLLLASFLATINPPKEDIYLFFAKRRKRQIKKKKRIAPIINPSALKRDKGFPIERMISIYHALRRNQNQEYATEHFHINSLIPSNLLEHPYHSRKIDPFENIRLKCSLSMDDACVIARSIGLDISGFIHIDS